jgi:hypothetical protein
MDFATDRRANQTRQPTPESVSVPIERRRPGVAALIVSCFA